MSFQQMLRDQLQHEADAVPLPERDPDRAVARARSQRRRRRVTAVAGLTAVVAVGAAVAAPRLTSEPADPLSMASPGQSGLVPTGPLDLEWRQAEGGLSNVQASFQADDGVVYALSTGPGARAEDHPDGDVPRALYRLAEDGTWQPVPLDGDRPRAADVAGGDGLLYAVSTGPAGGGSSTVRLSTSADGGDTWSAQDVEPVDPPSTVVDWQPSSLAMVESNGATTLALVETTFYPEVESLFPELADDESGSLAVEHREEGLVLVRYRPAEPTVEGENPGEEARIAQEEDRGAVTRSGAPETVEPDTEDIRTVPWSDLGVEGPEALDGRTQLFRWTGDTWEAVDGAGEALAGIGGADLQVAGDRFVATGWGRSGSEPTAFTSADGTSWTPVAVPGEGSLVSVGPALVHTPSDGTVIHVSGDAGATWSDVDLADAGVGDGALVASVDGGPLGLALVVVYPEDDRPGDLVVSGDLIDWTVTPLSDVVGLDGDTGEIRTVVGEDRIVVTGTEAPNGSSVPRSVTAVGTPVRTP